MKTITEYLCPVCSTALVSRVGQQIDPLDGISIECANRDCGMADWGHGKNAKEAFEVFKAKCGGK